MGLTARRRTNDTGHEQIVRRAYQIAEELQRMVAARASRPFTVSVGVAAVASRSAVDLDEALLMADQALYRAKSAGRGHVVRTELTRRSSGAG